MNRSIAFAATSLSAILLVAATLASPALAQERGRKIIINKTSDPVDAFTFDLAQPAEAAGGKIFSKQKLISDLAQGVQATPPKTQTLFSNTFPEGEQNTDASSIEEASTKTPIQPKAFTFNPKDEAPDEPISLSFPEGEQTIEPPLQQASNQTPVEPKAFTFNEREEAAAPQIGNDDDTDEEFAPPPKKLKKQPKEQIVDGIDDVAPPKKLVAPKKVEAENSDDIEDEEEDLETTKTKAKPAVEAAETDVEGEEAPAFKKKMRMHYSPSLRRYVETTDDDMGYDAAEFQDDSYEAPVYRQSYSRGYGHRDSYSSNYLPSCEN